VVYSESAAEAVVRRAAPVGPAEVEACLALRVSSKISLDRAS